MSGECGWAVGEVLKCFFFCFCLVVFLVFFAFAWELPHGLIWCCGFLASIFGWVSFLGDFLNDTFLGVSSRVFFAFVGAMFGLTKKLPREFVFL